MRRRLLLSALVCARLGSAVPVVAAEPSDTTLEAEARRLLRDDRDLTAVEVSAEAGVLTLRGNVPSTGARVAAEAAAAQLAGPTKVRSQLVVRPVP
jgi:osmotically-inducible protein OsmY